MSKNDASGTTPPLAIQPVATLAATPASVPKVDAILDAMHRHHRAVGAVVAAIAALALNGALLSGFDTVARRGLAAEFAAQQPKPGVQDAQQREMAQRAGMPAGEVRVVELPPVQIVGRRLAQETTPETAQATAQATVQAMVQATVQATVMETPVETVVQAGLVPPMAATLAAGAIALNAPTRAAGR